MLGIKSIFICNNVWKSRTFLRYGRIAFAFCSQSSSNLFEKQSDLDVEEEELEKKRFQSRLPETVYRKFVKKECPPIVQKEHFKKAQLRRTYGKFGEATGLNPGIAWPTREELLEILEHDKLVYRPLNEMLDNVHAAEQERIRQEQEYEAEVDRNMKKLDTHMKEYYAKIAKKQKEEEDRKLKQQQLIEEISELLGYDVDPKDPRFQEAVEMKKKEEKKAKKSKKQQESYEKMLARLANIAATSKKAEAIAESTDKEKQNDTPDVIQVSNETPESK